MKKVIHILAFIAILFFSSETYSQKLYIMQYNGPQKIEDCVCNTFHWEVRSNGVPIAAMSVVNEFLIYNIRPTYFYYEAYRPDSYSCSGPCRDDYYEGYFDAALNADCYPPYFIGNEVLVRPDIDTNSFCDAVNLAAVGCTGTQRFFWEYSKDGTNFTPTNVSTGFNQNYQFVKANFPALNNYTGNIYFRVVIDSDPTITGENVYSNTVNYLLTACSPLVDGEPITKAVECANETNGSVTVKMLGTITSNQQLLLNLYDEGGFKFHKFIKYDEIINKQFTWAGLAAGTYTIKYQAQSNIDNTDRVGSMPVLTPSFKILNKTPLKFSLTALNPLCNAGNGEIQITVSGGTGPYYYFLDNESTPHQFSSLDIIKNAGEGDHTVKVIDSNKCVEKP